jgi:hypothetical protein
MHDQTMSWRQHETHVCRTFTLRCLDRGYSYASDEFQSLCSGGATALSVVMDDRALMDNETCVVQMLCVLPWSGTAMGLL